MEIPQNLLTRRDYSIILNKVFSLRLQKKSFFFHSLLLENWYESGDMAPKDPQEMVGQRCKQGATEWPMS